MTSTKQQNVAHEHVCVYTVVQIEGLLKSIDRLTENSAYLHVPKEVAMSVCVDACKRLSAAYKSKNHKGWPRTLKRDIVKRVYAADQIARFISSHILPGSPNSVEQELNEVINGVL